MLCLYYIYHLLKGLDLEACAAYQKSAYIGDLGYALYIVGLYASAVEYGYVFALLAEYVLAICSVLATIPVPIAHTGS